MADNTTLNAGSGGDTIASDDISGVKHQRVKIQYGVDGSATDVSDTNPLPIDDAGGSITVDGTITANAGTGTFTVDGSGVTQPVSGTVTANLSATDNAVLDQIEVNTSYGDNTGGGTETGALRVTIANNSTGVLSVDDNGGSLTVDNADITTVAGAVHNEDDAHTTGDAGIQSLAVRNDSDSSLAGTSGDYTPLQVDSSGFLKVNIKAGAGSGGTASTDDASFTAGSGSGTPIMGFATSDTVDSGDVGVLAMDTSRNLKVSIEADNAGIGGGTQYTEDAAAAANPVGNMNMAVRADSLSAVTSADGDNIALRSTNNGELYVKQTDAVPVTDNGGSLTVDGTVTANLSATDNAVLDQIEVNTSYGDQTGGGTETGALRVTIANNSTGVLSVDDNGSTLSVDDGGGSLTIDGTVTANAGTGTFTVDLGANNDIQGDVAHDAADSGNPLKIGAKVETSPKGITAASDGDRTDLYADSDGQLIVKVGTTGADLVSERVSNTDGASTAFTNFSAVASTYNYVTAITIANTSATDGYVDFRDGTAGSVKWTVPIPGNGGATITCGGTPLFKTSANTALAYDVSAALTTVYISVSGYQSKV